MRKHTFLKHESCTHVNCPICAGGLSYCTTCKGAEGSLPTHCPGRPMTNSECCAVYDGITDYINGKWISRHGC